MPTAGQWTKFLVSAGGFLGLGVLTVTKLMPTDEEIIAKLSPDLKARYYKEKEIRHRADQLMQQKISENQDKPVWLQGSMKMREFEQQISEQARREVEQQHQLSAIEVEREELRNLVQKEKKM